MKVSLALCALLSLVAAEPPVSREYLPPSSQYGAPSASSGLSTQYSAPSTQYGAPSTQYGAPSSQYGAPGGAAAYSARPAARVSSRIGGARGLSRRVGAGRMIGGGLSTQYGAPSSFGRSSFGGSSGISTEYGAPSAFSSAGGPSTQYGAPSTEYGAPSAYSAAAGLSSQYGAPSASYSRLGGSAGLSTQYGVPGYGYGRGGAQEDPLAEPANYEFSYAVQDESSLSDFGHDEVRQEESAEGEYRVLLPDGRKQIVRYQADQDGYRPEISYEDTGITAYSAGYGRGPNNQASGGYHY